MTPLIKDPAIQNALTNKLTSEIVTKIDVKGRADQAAAELSQKGFTRIGGLLKGVSGSLASGVQGFVHSRIHKIITGPRMANAWVQVNRVAQPGARRGRCRAAAARTALSVSATARSPSTWRR